MNMTGVPVTDCELDFAAVWDWNRLDGRAAIGTHFPVLRVVFIASRTNHFSTS